MKTSTILLAVWWAAVGVMAIWIALINSPLANGEFTWFDVLWYLGWGIPSLIGACCIFARRAAGWWVIAAVNGLAIIFWTYRLFAIRNVPVKPGMDGQILFAAVVIALSLLFFALLSDRPSGWRTPASSRKAGDQMPVDK